VSQPKHAAAGDRDQEKTKENGGQTQARTVIASHVTPMMPTSRSFLKLGSHRRLQTAADGALMHLHASAEIHREGKPVPLEPLAHNARIAVELDDLLDQCDAKPEGRPSLRCKIGDVDLRVPLRAGRVE
jgi:hypothetical protein